MTEDGPKLHIDSDWKTEAAQEKERLAEQERQEKSKEGDAPATGSASFLELVNMLVMQAAIAFGGMQTASGEHIPANPESGKHFIDLLEVLQKKTEGNLSDDETRLLGSVLHELRMQYVHAVSPPPADLKQEPQQSG